VDRESVRTELEECGVLFLEMRLCFDRSLTNLSFRKAPASGGFGKICCVFVLAEGGFGFDSIDVAAGRCEHGFDISAVFFVVDACKALPDRPVFDFLRDAFEDNGFVGLLGTDRAVRVGGDVFCLAGIWASTKPKCILPPDSPDEHQMRAAAGARRSDPIVVRFFQALEGPAPGFETLGRILWHVGKVRPVGTAWSGFVHECLRAWLFYGRNSNRIGIPRELGRTE